MMNQRNGDHRRIVLTPASDIKPHRVEWPWDGRIAIGTLALLAGREGLGKSILAYTLAAWVTRGMLPGEHFETPKSSASRGNRGFLVTNDRAEIDRSRCRSRPRFTAWK
jgi:AAA domain